MKPSEEEAYKRYPDMVKTAGGLWDTNKPIREAFIAGYEYAAKRLYDAIEHRNKVRDLVNDLFNQPDEKH